MKQKKILDEMILENPQNLDALNNLAVISILKGNNKTALGYLKTNFRI